MATNSRNNNNEEVMVDETLSPDDMAKKLGISDDGTSDQPPLSFYATGDDGYPSNEQKRKPLKERIKENWEAFKATLKTTKGKVTLALATLAGFVIMAVTGTGIAAGVAAGDVNSAVDRANDVLNNEYVTRINEDLSKIEPYVAYFTAKEQTRVDEVETEAKNWEENSEELSKIIANVQANKNVFSARDTAKNELVPKTNELAGIDLSADSAYVSNLLTAVQARAGQANATNQETIQSIINGEGTYYNMGKIQDTMNQIDGYFVDADGNGTADIVETVNGIKDTKLKNLANKALASMNGAKASADITFETLQANWNKFTEYANSGDYATALSYYNTDIAPAASKLNKNLGSVQTGYDQIQNCVQNDQQRETVIRGSFTENERNTYLKDFKGAGINGTIDKISYVYNSTTGETEVRVESTVKSQNRVTILRFNTTAGYPSIDAGSIVDAFKKASAVPKTIYTMSNETQYGSLTTSNNGSSQTITGDFNIGYSTTLNSANGMTTITINVIAQSKDGQIFSLGETSKTVAGDANIERVIEDMVSSKIQSAGFSNSIENDIDLQ